VIAKSESLIHAEKVLSLCRSLAKDLKFKLHLGVWSNGREQGFYLTRMEGAPETWPALVFAQYRTSDSTVVVFGAYHQFDVTTHAPAEELWGGESNGHMKFFPSDKDDKAAKFIVEYLAYYPLQEEKLRAEAEGKLPSYTNMDDIR
jgi:hypothetical protein